MLGRMALALRCDANLWSDAERCWKCEILSLGCDSDDPDSDEMIMLGDTLWSDSFRSGCPILFVDVLSRHSAL